MNYYTDVNEEMQYLSQFYTLAQIDKYAKGASLRVKKLHNLSQPKRVPIGSLMKKVHSSNYLVTSPDGWVPVTDCLEKIKSDMYEFVFKSGKTITASHDHLYQKIDLSWHYARDLSTGDTLLAEAGTDCIVDIKRINKSTRVYDLTVNHHNHRYYTDTICSHNSGKSLFMQNLAVNWVEQGLSGAYITLELSEDLCAMRIDSMMTDTATNAIFKNLDDVELKVKVKAKIGGKFRIKYMPAQSNVNDIRSYVRELQVQTGVKVEFLCVDYLDLLMPATAKVNPNDLFVKDKYVSEELRNLGKELDVLMVTASQLNRCLKLDTIVEANGKLVQIKDVQVGDYLTSNDGPVQVYEVLPITKQPVFKVTTKSGKEIVCSSKHKFPTTGGIKTLETGLKVGDKLQSLRSRDK